jgi:hypothetical protein
LLAGTPAIITKVKGEENLVELKRPKPGKGKGCFFAASAYFAKGGPFESYPAKESGNQSFAALVNEKDKSVSFTLPASALPKKPVQKRTKKVKPATNGAAVVPVAPTEDGELMLQPA